MKNLYRILAVPPHASLEQIRTAYRRLARETHPDHQPGDKEAFVAIQQAYAVLSSPDKRTAYDAERLAWMGHIGAVACQACGSANRITHRPAQNEVARCAHCKTELEIPAKDLRAAQKRSLVREASHLIDEVGVELADLAADAVRSGIGRLRQRLGIAKSQRSLRKA